ncbi:unnamed protein product [Thlaspi arvense]|uniref:Laccase n=1 Tax=Thlaspi arvense TaxID=13288 RepID=A0AAU9SBP9_THLAR|nr:unnamed protein product [Thlaspi arvense]
MENPWSDGPEYVTQCPIKPGANFTYDIILSTEEGTLWWHAHSDWSRATVHGAIIVYPKNGTNYPFTQPDDQFPIFLASWFKGDVMEIVETALDDGGEFNISDAFTINGQTGNVLHGGKSHLHPCGNGWGLYQALETDYILISPGQTMDVLIKANQTPNHYYMAARALEGVVYNNSTTTALVKYSGNYNAAPSFPDLPYYNDTDAAESFVDGIRSLASEEHPIDVPQTVDTHMYITVSMNAIPCINNSCDGPNGSRLAASLNNISFQTPSMDILQAYYKQIGGVFTTDFPDEPPYYYNFTGSDFPDNVLIPTLGTRVRVVEYNTSMEMVFQGTNVLDGAENHPMHLHGFSFYFVGSGYGIFNNETDPKSYNLVDPPEVNTIGVPKNGWAAVRFRADNPGVWFMHCHLDRHSSWGMDMAFIVKNGTTNSTSILPPPRNLNPC